MSDERQSVSLHRQQRRRDAATSRRWQVGWAVVSATFLIAPSIIMNGVGAWLLYPLPVVLPLAVLFYWLLRYRRVLKTCTRREDVDAFIHSTRDKYARNRLIWVQYEMARASLDAVESSPSDLVIEAGQTESRMVFASKTSLYVLIAGNAVLLMMAVASDILFDDPPAVLLFAVACQSSALWAWRAHRSETGRLGRRIWATREMSPSERWAELLAIAAVDPG